MTTFFTQRVLGGSLARAAALCLLALAAVLLRPSEAKAQMIQPTPPPAQWTTNGNNITTTGNVGIGTTTPSQMFHVHSIGTWAGTRVTTGSTGTTINDGVHFGYDDAYGAYIWNREATSVVISTSNLERMRVSPTGNIGIGTTTPGVVNGFNFAPYISMHVQTPGGGAGSIAVDSSNPASGIVLNDSSQPADSRMWSISQAAGGGKLSFRTYADSGAAASDKVVIDRSGNVGVGISNPTAKLHVDGSITVTGNINAKYQDVAEWVPSTQKLAAGTVVILDTGRNNHVLASKGSYDTRVAGVISAQPGIALGEAGEGKVLVATTGRVKVRVDATQGPIKVGDILVTSDRQGYAMKSEPVLVGKRQMHAPGTIIGKALESLAGGTGEILVLLSLQ